MVAKNKAVLADVDVWRKVIPDDVKPNIVNSLQSKNWTPYFKWTYSDDPESMNTPTDRFLKGALVEHMLAEICGGTSVNQVGYDVELLGFGEFNRGEIKFGPPPSKVRGSAGIYNLSRKLKNTLSTGTKTCHINFDYLFVLSPESVYLYFGDQLNDFIFEVDDGFQFTAPISAGHLIAQNTLSPDSYFVGIEQTGNMISKALKERAGMIIREEYSFEEIKGAVRSSVKKRIESTINK